MLILQPDLGDELAELYRLMEEAYDEVAQQLGHGCEGCPDNCCDSFFTHHTYIEWAYLWHGLAALDDGRRRDIIAAAAACRQHYRKAVQRDERPRVMCPLNRGGRCELYQYRLMVCRTHGVPATMTRPDGKVFHFPGCFRCQELVASRQVQSPAIPIMERTALLHRLALLEKRFVQQARGRLPRLKMTIADMIVSGPPVGS